MTGIVGQTDVGRGRAMPPTGVTANALTPPIGYYGSKARIARRIVDLLPPHRGYVEPYAGGLSVLLAKGQLPFEVANDLDGDLMGFWRVLRDRPEELARACALTPHSRGEYAPSWPIPDDVTDEVERARRVWVKLSQGRGGALRSTGWRYFQAAGDCMPGTLRSYIDRMMAVAQRLAGVTLEALPALEIIDRYGGDPDTLLYVDPPYLFSTRAKTGIYRHEMGDPQPHVVLAEALHATAAAVVISGYPDPLYDEQLYVGWHRAQIPAHTGQCNDKGVQQRTEILWSNRPLGQQQALF